MHYARGWWNVTFQPLCQLAIFSSHLRISLHFPTSDTGDGKHFSFAHWHHVKLGKQRALKGHCRRKRLSLCVSIMLSFLLASAWLQCGILSRAHLPWVASFSRIPTRRFQVSSTGNLAGFPETLTSLQWDNSYYPPSKYPFQPPSLFNS